MSLSGLLRAAWVAVPAALMCGSAVAQQVITVPPGVTVILSPGQMPLVSNSSRDPVLVETTQAPSATQVERIFAEQRAMMDRMIADMDAMFAPMQNQTGTIEAMLRQFGAPALAGVPTGATFCSESVSITYNGTAPVVKVSRAGNGCGPATGSVPVPTQTAPHIHREPNVIEINNPTPSTRQAVRHHT
jgi:hypothetical protein